MLSQTRCFAAVGTHYGHPFLQDEMELDPAVRQTTRDGMEHGSVYVADRGAYEAALNRTRAQIRRLLDQNTAGHSARALNLLQDLEKVQRTLEKFRLQEVGQ